MANPIDRYSADWKAVKAFCHEQRDTAVAALIEGGGQDERLRGRIEFIDELLRLPETVPPPEITVDPYT